uniref:MARVEL domain-containing protein n=1 Tax=Rhabditophanes sp. KR3021 TaxID=114890 RepID=A0AC35UD76_9BILA
MVIRYTCATTFLRLFKLLLCIVSATLILLGPTVLCQTLTESEYPPVQDTTCSFQYIKVSDWDLSTSGIYGQWALIIIPFVYSLIIIYTLVSHVCLSKQKAVLFLGFLVYFITGCVEMYFALWYFSPDTLAGFHLEDLDDSVIQGWIASSSLLFLAAFLSLVDMAFVHHREHYSDSQDF